jgi:predicted TIM-barrel fold metal-dependent hydrolase
MAARVIALEEHFWTPGLRAARTDDVISSPKLIERLGDLDALRLREMDEAGVDLQVLSETEPATQNLPADQAVSLARESNDILHEAIGRHPERFAGFATLPTPDPRKAAQELERAIKTLGFRGCMINGLTHGRFPDEPEFRPIFEAAAALDVPIYLHPATPHPAVLDAYYKTYPQLSRAPLGFGQETAVAAMRLVLSGVFDEFPKLQIILGHLGETIPFWLWRASDTLTRVTKLRRSFRDYFLAHFHVTTSGFFSPLALQNTIAEIGIERVMFSVDWPFQPAGPAVAFVNATPLSPGEREQIFASNARKLLKL